MAPAWEGRGRPRGRRGAVRELEGEAGFAELGAVPSADTVGAVAAPALALVEGDGAGVSLFSIEPSFGVTGMAQRVKRSAK